MKWFFFHFARATLRVFLKDFPDNSLTLQVIIFAFFFVFLRSVLIFKARCDFSRKLHSEICPSNDPNFPPPGHQRDERVKEINYWGVRERECSNIYSSRSARNHRRRRLWDCAVYARDLCNWFNKNDLRSIGIGSVELGRAEGRRFEYARRSFLYIWNLDYVSRDDWSEIISISTRNWRIFVSRFSRSVGWLVGI